MSVDYTRLSLGEVRAALEESGREAQAAFDDLDARQVNWKPEASRWSVAQCVEHLLTANQLMFEQAGAALDGTRPPTIWERLPLLPGVFGRLLIRSQAPDATRKFTAPAPAQPAASDLAPEIIERFVQQHRDLAAWVQALDERRAARAIMTSPFVRVVTYSVLDGLRLVVAHDRRHIEQARRVMQAPGFPVAGP